MGLRWLGAWSLDEFLLLDGVDRGAEDVKVEEMLEERDAKEKSHHFCDSDGQVLEKSAKGQRGGGRRAEVEDVGQGVVVVFTAEKHLVEQDLLQDSKVPVVIIGGSSSGWLDLDFLAEFWWGCKAQEHREGQRGL